MKKTVRIIKKIVKKPETNEINVKTEDKDISFHKEIMKICQRCFLDFVDTHRSMDEHNENTSDNYKGFMTFMGLLYSRGIISIKIVIDCLDTIKHAIFSSVCESSKHDTVGAKHSCCDYGDKLMGSKKQLDTKLIKSICYYDCDKCVVPTEDTKLITYRKHIECINLHKGYEHLLTHVVHTLESKTNELIKLLGEKSLSIKNLTSLIQCIKDKSITSNVKEYFGEKFDTLDNDKMIQLLNSDLASTTEAYTSLLSTVDKICEYLDTIINMHQDIVYLNKCYKSMNKNQLVAPFRQYSIINHNSIGMNLNKLQAKLSEYNDKYTTKYIPMALTKSIPTTA